MRANSSNKCGSQQLVLRSRRRVRCAFRWWHLMIDLFHSTIKWKKKQHDCLIEMSKHIMDRLPQERLEQQTPSAWSLHLTAKTAKYYVLHDMPRTIMARESTCAYVTKHLETSQAPCAYPS